MSRADLNEDGETLFGFEGVGDELGGGGITKGKEVGFGMLAHPNGVAVGTEQPPGKAKDDLR